MTKDKWRGFVAGGLLGTGVWALTQIPFNRPAAASQEPAPLHYTVMNMETGDQISARLVFTGEKNATLIFEDPARKSSRQFIFEIDPQAPKTRDSYFPYVIGSKPVLLVEGMPATPVSDLTLEAIPENQASQPEMPRV